MAVIELHPVFKSGRYTNDEVESLLDEKLDKVGADAPEVTGDGEPVVKGYAADGTKCRLKFVKDDDGTVTVLPEAE